MLPLRVKKVDKNKKLKKIASSIFNVFYDILIEGLNLKYITIAYRHGLLTNIIQLNIVINFAFVQKMKSEERTLVCVHFDGQRVTIKILF